MIPAKNLCSTGGAGGPELCAINLKDSWQTHSFPAGAQLSRTGGVLSSETCTRQFSISEGIYE
jgi:hypothetical protein